MTPQGSHPSQLSGGGLVARKGERAWIVYPDARRFGPFESVDLAIQVRFYVEKVERREDLAIKRESEL